MAKKKEELKPMIVEVPPMLEQPPQSRSNFDNEEILVKKQDGSGDSFFRNVLNKLFNNDDISLKTEYLNVMENFTGTKLEFLSGYGNMPYLKEFMTIFEVKRVSLGRKGRQEIIMALQQRQQEIEQNNANKLKMALGLQ